MSSGHNPSMYYLVVAFFMVLLPMGSAAVEHLSIQTPVDAALIGKWFAFWSVGCRLILAGTRQVIQPSYTANVILGLQGTEPLVLVRELGFANLAIGALGVVSLFLPSWRMAAALVGMIFYGLAGFGHVAQKHRNNLANVALVSDLFVSGVLLCVCVAVVLHK
jgi:hypothetical protein